jgi:hypothetical protein
LLEQVSSQGWLRLDLGVSPPHAFKCPCLASTASRSQAPAQCWASQSLLRSWPAVSWGGDQLQQQAWTGLASCLCTPGKVLWGSVWVQLLSSRFPLGTYYMAWAGGSETRRGKPRAAQQEKPHSGFTLAPAESASSSHISSLRILCAPILVAFSQIRSQGTWLKCYSLCQT